MRFQSWVEFVRNSVRRRRTKLLHSGTRRHDWPRLPRRNRRRQGGDDPFGLSTCAEVLEVRVLLNGVTISTNKTISANDFSYDGADLIVSGASVTIQGSHSFHSLDLISHASVLDLDPNNAGTQ